jgi:hypothetical protein
MRTASASVRVDRMEGPTKWPGERDLRGRVQQPGLEAADVTDSTTPASKPAYPLYHEHMDHGPSWLTNLLRLYDPAQLAAKDAAFIRAEITRYVKEATEVESLSPLTELLRWTNGFTGMGAGHTEATCRATRGRTNARR